MKRLSLLCILVLMIISGCKKNSGSGSVIAVYKLKTFTRIAGKCQVDPANAQLEEAPTVANDDIASYEQRKHVYTIKDGASERIQQLGDNVPLAMTVGGEVIFYFFNKPWYSSSTCFESITLDPMTKNKMTLYTGYPGASMNPPEDLRNDSRLITALRNQGKLR